MIPPNHIWIVFGMAVLIIGLSLLYFKELLLHGEAKQALVDLTKDYVSRCSQIIALKGVINKHENHLRIVAGGLPIPDGVGLKDAHKLLDDPEPLLFGSSLDSWVHEVVSQNQELQHVTYGSTQVFDNESDMYEHITGRRSDVFDSQD